MKEKVMRRSEARLKNLLENREQHLIPRGEIWFGSDFLQGAGFDDTLDNHFRLAALLGHDIVCLSVAEKAHQSRLGYRYFEPCELRSSLKERTGLLAAVVDGPFQRMVDASGLMEVLMDWVKDKDAMWDAYKSEQKTALVLIDQLLDIGVDAIILADDLAGDQAPLINPRDLDVLCTPFYQQAVTSIRGAGVLAFYHCCGNMTQLIPLIKTWQLDGFAAIQTGKNNLELLDKEVGGILLTGIDAALLETAALSTEDLQSLEKLVARYTKQKRLVLCSDCGLYRPEQLGRLQHIYSELDRLVR